MMHAMKKEDLPKAGSALEAELAVQFRLHNITPEREFRFHDERRWRFDFAWPHLLFAVEVEGITYEGGRHQRVEGFENDLDKYQSAMMLNWVVYRVSKKQIRNLEALTNVQLMLERLSDGNTSKNTGIL